MIEKKRIGFALTGSFCTISTAIDCMAELIAHGADVTPIISHILDTSDTKFGKAESLKAKLKLMTRHQIITTIPSAEPIGPGDLFDLLIVLPASGNTMAKIVAGIADTPVTMAVKAHLRNGGPVLLGIASNDALGLGAKNIGQLLSTRNIYFVPFGQDDAEGKPRSMVFKKEYVIPAIIEALDGKQIQPILA